MTAADLIRQLQAIPPDTIMFVWVDGERMPVSSALAVDHWDDSHADINVDINADELQFYDPDNNPNRETPETPEPMGA